MIAAKDIKDTDTLKQWLTEWPESQGIDEEAARKVAVSIAHRAAMRVFPIAWTRQSAKDFPQRNLSTLSILRCSLISGIESSFPSPKIGVIYSAVIAAHDIAENSIVDDTDAATNAVFAAVDATASVSELGYVRGVAAAARAAGFAFFATSESTTVSGVHTSVVWKQIQNDAGGFERGEDVVNSGLWYNDIPPWFDAKMQDVRENLSEDGGVWEFWLRWWERSIKGDLLPDALLTEIAVIDDTDWEKGPSHIAKLIAEIEKRFDGASKDKSLREIFTATLYDFSFDKIAGVMRAIPIGDDWKHLEDKERLAKFLTDAQDLREDMQLLATALSAEGSGMQGAGGVRTYATQVLNELDKAEDVGTLRVGKLMEYGRILEAAAQRDDTLREFGALAEPFKMCVEKLREIIRDHFAYTLSRMDVLKEIHMEPDADPWQVMHEFRGIVTDVKSGADSVLPALAAEDAAVLDDVLDSIERMMRALSESESEDNRSSLRKEIDFQYAKVAATAGVYRDKAAKIVGKGDDAADTALKAHKKYEGIRALGRAIKEGFENLGGGP